MCHIASLMYGLGLETCGLGLGKKVLSTSLMVAFCGVGLRQLMIETDTSL